MDDITYKEYIDIINNLEITITVKGKLYELINKKPYHLDDNISNNFIMDIIEQGTEYHLVAKIFECLEEDIKPFLAYKKWKNKFIAVVHNKLGEVSGHEKNLFFSKVYNLFQNSSNLNLKHKDNQNYFISLFKKSVILKAKNEEQSVVHVLHSLFRDKEKLPKNFLMELFAIYVEYINTDEKYQSRIKEIKAWAINEDFSELSNKYKKIKNYFNTDLNELICSASVKRYDLNSIAEKTSTKLIWVEENFTAINKLLSEKLANNTNVHNFTCIDEKLFHKVVLVYEKRDSIIEVATNIHDIFFSMINKTKSLENEMINDLWNKLVLKTEIENDFEKYHKKNPKNIIQSKVKKI